ncbi:MAG: hypothetical protein WAN65_19215 [Candidatus Sulfotelmatobacter sp.]
MATILQMPSNRRPPCPVTAERIEEFFKVQECLEAMTAALYADLPNAKFPVRVGSYRINDRKRPMSVVVME